MTPGFSANRKTFRGWHGDYDVRRELRRDNDHDDACDLEQIMEAKAERERYAGDPVRFGLLPRRGAA